MSHTQGPTSYSAIKLFMEGRKILSAKKAEAEKDKLGTLRGGSVGALIGSDVLGVCHRIALARYKGLSSPADDGTHCIWEAGEMNEINWTRMLEASWEGTVTGDSAYPLKWELMGKSITGRPDHVLLNPDGTPAFGLEDKNIESIQSAAGLFYENKPKTDNLIQAGHYSLKFGIPWILAYNFSGQGEVPWWTQKKFNLTKGTKVKPFKKEFKLFWQDGQLGYVKDTGESVLTIVTAESIEQYYTLILEMDQEKDLFLRHSSKDLQGNQQPWSQCDYCPAKLACDSYEQHGLYDLFFDELARDWGIV